MLTRFITTIAALHLALAPALASQPTDRRIDLASYGVTAELPSGAGFAYLSEVASRPDTTLQPIILLDYAHTEIDRQISPAAIALLSIAVGLWVGGLNIIQGIESAFWQGFAKAGLSSVITQTAAGVVSGDLDIGEMLKGAAFAGLGAGLSATINLGELVKASPNSLLGIPAKGDAFAILSPGALLDGFGDSLVSASLGVIQNGGSFGDALAGSFGSFLASQSMAAFQNGIGDLTLKGLEEGSLGHVLLHGTVGCAFAEVSGGDCRAGFAAGAAASLYSGALEGTSLSDLEQQNRAELLGAFVGFFVSSGKGDNVSLAGQVSQSAIANNRQLHRDEAERIAENADAFRAWACDVAGACDLTLEQAIGLLTLGALNQVDSRFDEATWVPDYVADFLANIGGDKIAWADHYYFEANQDQRGNHQLNARYLLDILAFHDLATAMVLAGDRANGDYGDAFVDALGAMRNTRFNNGGSAEDMALLGAMLDTLPEDLRAEVINRVMAAGSGGVTGLEMTAVAMLAELTDIDEWEVLAGQATLMIDEQREFGAVIQALTEKKLSGAVLSDDEIWLLDVAIGAALAGKAGQAASALAKLIKLPSFQRIKLKLVGEGRLQRFIADESGSLPPLRKGNLTIDASPSKHELDVGGYFSDSGFDVRLRGTNVTGPDMQLGGSWWVIKELAGTGKRALQSALNAAKVNFSGNAASELGLTRADTRAVIDVRGNPVWDNFVAVGVELSRLQNLGDLKNVTGIKIITSNGTVDWGRQ